MYHTCEVLAPAFHWPNGHHMTSAIGMQCAGEMSGQHKPDLLFSPVFNPNVVQSW